MLRNEKFLLGLSICFTFLFIFPTKAFANVDFSLEDNTETREFSVIINSNDEYIDGLDITIVMSEGVTINENLLPENIEICTLGGRAYTVGNKLHIECFNEAGSVMEGTLLTASYTADTSDYYFYIDTNSLDLGLKELGVVTNINYSGEIEEDTNQDEITEDESFQDSIINFMSENLFYIAGGVILIIILIVMLMGRTPKEKILAQEEKKATEAKDTEEQQN